MNAEAVIDVARDALWTLLLVSMPMLLVGMLVGLVISILQAATQINEMTMTFVPKMIAVFLTMLLLLPWLLSHMMAFTERIFARIAAVGGP
jgi:flagellar biosynthetic protein FliQ